MDGMAAGDIAVVGVGLQRVVVEMVLVGSGCREVGEGEPVHGECAGGLAGEVVRVLRVVGVVGEGRGGLGRMEEH